MKYVILCFAVCVTSPLFSQTITGVKPNDFPIESNPNQTNFEFYTQKNNINAKSDFNSVRKGMSPKAQVAIPIPYTPTATGNPISDWAKFVKTVVGDVYYIDGEGRAMSLGSQGENGTSEVQYNKTGATIISGYPIPSDPKKYRIERGGVNLLLTNDFTILGSNTINFVELLQEETIRIIISSSNVN
jgi:hypothetical protein